MTQLLKFVFITVLFALFTINHTVYTRSSSVSPCSSRFQSNTTFHHSLNECSFFSPYLWPTFIFFCKNTFLHLHSSSTFFFLFYLPQLSPISYGILICIIFPFHKKCWHNMWLIKTNFGLKECFNNIGPTWRALLHNFWHLFFILEMLMIRKRDSLCTNNSICQCPMWWRPLTAAGTL